MATPPPTITCCSCLRTLTFVPGMALVSCPACGSVSNLRPLEPLHHPQRAGLVRCSGCSNFMLFPVGIPAAICLVCHTVNATPPPRFYNCGCGLFVMAAAAVPGTICTACLAVRPGLTAPCSPFPLAPLPPGGRSLTQADKLSARHPLMPLASGQARSQLVDTSPTHHAHHHHHHHHHHQPPQPLQAPSFTFSIPEPDPEPVPEPVPEALPRQPLPQEPSPHPATRPLHIIRQSASESALPHVKAQQPP